MIRFWLSLYRRRNDPPADWSQVGQYASVRIRVLPYDHEARGDFSLPYASSKSVQGTDQERGRRNGQGIPQR